MTTESIVRIGQGYDLHRLTPDRPFILAGVKIPSPLGLLGHSDADVLIHAVIDALLGAAGLDDIGQQFPDTDSKYKDIASTDLLKKTLTLINDAGYAPVNIDTTIIAEQPKIGPHKKILRQNLAQLLHLPPEAVNIKAKTNEKLEATGTGQAVACHAIASLKRI